VLVRVEVIQLRAQLLRAAHLGAELGDDLLSGIRRPSQAADSSASCGGSGLPAPASARLARSRGVRWV